MKLIKDGNIIEGTPQEIFDFLKLHQTTPTSIHSHPQPLQPGSTQPHIKTQQINPNYIPDYVTIQG